MMAGARERRLAEIVAAAAALWGVKPELIVHRTRAAVVVDPRMAVMWLLRREGWTLTEIAAAMRRHHGSVHHAVLRVERRCEVDPEYRRLVHALMQNASGAGPYVELLLQLAEAARGLERLAVQMRFVAQELQKSAGIAIAAELAARPGTAA